MKFKDGDLVQIFKQPPGLVLLKGYKGFIDEIHGNSITFHALLPSEGYGSVKLNCVKPCDDPELVLRKKEYDQQIKNMEMGIKYYCRDLSKLAKKHRVSKKRLMKLYRSVEDLRTKYEASMGLLLTGRKK